MGLLDIGLFLVGFARKAMLRVFLRALARKGAIWASNKKTRALDLKTFSSLGDSDMRHQGLNWWGLPPLYVYESSVERSWLLK